MWAQEVTRPYCAGALDTRNLSSHESRWRNPSVGHPLFAYIYIMILLQHQRQVALHAQALERTVEVLLHQATLLL
jgi:hypothetical protein